ncbi:hypothetical protein H6F89_11430 [Cyanobacteria bacterium FACHB-63]|nr:hypothetical protein [Cyanobacteria bacterium FACHB-63]
MRQRTIDLLIEGLKRYEALKQQEKEKAQQTKPKTEPNEGEENETKPSS